VVRTEAGKIGGGHAALRKAIGAVPPCDGGIEQRVEVHAAGLYLTVLDPGTEDFKIRRGNFWTGGAYSSRWWRIGVAGRFLKTGGGAAGVFGLLPPAYLRGDCGVVRGLWRGRGQQVPHRAFSSVRNDRVVNLGRYDVAFVILPGATIHSTAWLLVGLSSLLQVLIFPCRDFTFCRGGVCSAIVGFVAGRNRWGSWILMDR